MNAAYRSARNELAALDARCDAFLRNAVANRASRVQGRALLGTANASFRARPSARSAKRARAADGRARHAPLSGATLRARARSSIARTAQKVLLFGAARGVLSAAVRLGIAGSFEAQRMQWNAPTIWIAIGDRCRGVDA